MRIFLFRGLGVFCAVIFAFFAQTSLAAQAPFEELEDYLVLDNPIKPSGKQVVVEEAFWYGCPHCNALHPYLETWLKRKPAFVDFRLLAVPFEDGNPWTFHARLFYSLQQMGKTEQTHSAIFHTIHTKKKPLANLQQAAVALKQYGVTLPKLEKTFKGFQVSLKIAEARKRVKQYQISGVPTLIVNGKYVVNPASAKNFGRMILILDFLIKKAQQENQARKNKK